MTGARDEIPEKVGRFIIVESIGFGAMGAVYRAEDPLIKRTVAIKTIRLDVPPQSPMYKSFLDRFFKEVKIAGALSHPNIVTLFDVGETEDKMPWLAMEYVEGKTVAELLDAGVRMEPERIVGLVSQMASGIDYAHTKGVIHRDIKPSNVIVSGGDKVKITDFGIAKLMDSDVTQTGSLLGTPSYMSPEQAMGDHLDGRTDIFSLGVVAFEMLSGVQPFPGNNVTSILYKLVHSDPVRPTNLEVLGLLPDRWQLVFSKVLAKNPSDRHQSAAAFVSDLEMCLGSWFGALEGETVLMTTPAAAAGGGARGPATEEEPPEEQAEETVVMRSSEYEEETLPESPGEGSGQTGRERTITLLPDSGVAQAAASSVRASEAQEAGDGASGGEAPTVLLGSAEAEPRTVSITFPDPDSAAQTKPPSPALEEGMRPVSKFPQWLDLRVVLIAVAAMVLLAVGVVGVLLLRARGSLEPPPVATAQQSSLATAGELVIRSDPEEATVWIDGEEVGVTPLEVADLELGSHLLRLEKDGFL